MNFLCRCCKRRIVRETGKPQLIYTDDSGKRHELLHGYFGGHSDVFELGNDVNQE